MKYWDGKPVLSKAKIISKPTRLMMVNIAELARITRGLPAKVKGGVVPGLLLGECLFVSTSKGILESREALKRNLGGVLVCRVS